MLGRNLALYVEVFLASYLSRTVIRADYCDIKLRIYDSCNASNFEEFCVENGPELFSHPYYDASLCNTVIVGQSFQSNSTGPKVVPTIEALTSRCNETPLNIILLDNSNHTYVPTLEYPVLVGNNYEDSKRYSEVLSAAVDRGKLNISCVTGVGFSIGAQLVGQVCRQLGKRHENSKCRLIYGSDPAGPGYMPAVPLLTSLLPQTQIVSKSDACIVVLLHCNKGFLGTEFSTGHYDVIVNGGRKQPNCSILDQPNVCSHYFCNDLLDDIIRNPGRCRAAPPGESSDVFSVPLTSLQKIDCENQNQNTLQLTTTEAQC